MSHPALRLAELVFSFNGLINATANMSSSYCNSKKQNVCLKVALWCQDSNEMHCTVKS